MAATAFLQGGKLCATVTLDEFVPINQTPREKIVGIYVLCYGNEVIYVGKSTDVFSRLKTHQSSKPYTQAFYKRVDLKELDSQEESLIRQFNPPLNTANSKNTTPGGVRECLHQIRVAIDTVARLNGFTDKKEINKCLDILRSESDRIKTIKSSYSRIIDIIPSTFEEENKNRQEFFGVGHKT